MTEIYDLETAGLNDSRLVNLSRTDAIQVASDLMLSGFVIDGSVAKTLLIRAVGPTLRALGITDALNQPHLKIFDGANRLVTSSGAWETNGVSDGIILASARIGAFALPRGSADCSTVTTLPPGSYTVHVTGAARDAGNVLLEVYEVP